MTSLQTAGCLAAFLDYLTHAHLVCLPQILREPVPFMARLVHLHGLLAGAEHLTCMPRTNPRFARITSIQRFLLLHSIANTIQPPIYRRLDMPPECQTNIKTLICFCMETVL